MEQRALIASLVLGCVTAAGAGGYLAVRQMAPAQAPEPVVATTPAPDPTEGTVADLGASDAVQPEALEGRAGAQVGRAGSQSPALESASGSTAPRATAERAVPATTPRPVPPPTAARTSGPAPRTESRPAPVAASQTTTAPAPRDEPARSTWPAPAADTQAPAQAQAPDTARWPADGRVGTTGPTGSRDPVDTTRDTTTADASIPSRQPAAEPVDPPAPLRRLEEVTIPRDAVIGLQVETTVSSDRARVEDPVRARVTRDVLANGAVVIPAGSKLLGSVTMVDEGGRIKERARLGVKFHTLVLANGTEVRLPTEVIYREGEEVAGRAAAKIGGAAIGGAILGAIMGGGKGAVIGAATGAGSGTGWAMAGDRKPAELRAGQSVTVRVSDSVTTQQ